MKRLICMLMALFIMMTGVISCSEDTTAPEPAPVNRAPGQPSINTAAGAPDDGATGVATNIDLHWNCTDPDGDNLTFDVYFGTASPPPEVSTGQTENSYDVGVMAFSTTFYWKVVAKDPANRTTSSAEWSFTTMAQPLETVSTPNTPTGPAGGETSEDLTFTTGGAVSSMTHSVQYRFDWGDGNFSDWAAGTSAQHSWGTAGSYEVKARARCQSHQAVESAWSAAYTVTITAPAVETVSAPDAPSGPASGETGENLYYTSGGAVSSEGHTLQYRYDKGDGNYTTWSSNGNAYLNYQTAGTYDVRVQARCQTHPAVESAWSTALSVTITVPPETVSRPTITGHPDVGGVGEEQSFFANYAQSSEYHPVEYRYDYGDGTIGPWSSSRSGAHTYSTAGTYEVKAQGRCATHTDIESAWSDAVTLEITDATEAVSTPTFTYPSEYEVAVGENLYLRLASSSNLGHYLEYRFDLGNGTITTWSSSYDKNASWDAVGDYQVKGQARCRDHTDVESAWSDAITIQVVEGVTQPTDISGPATGTVGQQVTFTTTGSTSSEGHDLEYRLYVSTSYAFLGVPQTWLPIDGLVHTFNSAGTFYIRVQARCATHLTESNPSAVFTAITISQP